MATILLIDDEPSILKTLKIFLGGKGHTVYTAQTGDEGLSLYHQWNPDLVILDIRLPDRDGLSILSQIHDEESVAKVIMITAYQDMKTAIQAMKNGAYDYIRKPLDIDEIEASVDRAIQVLTIEQDFPLLDTVEKPEDIEVIIGKSRRMLDIFKKIGLLCQHRAPVLIQGETGSGKGLAARMIHRNSPYFQEPFVTLDCSAVVESLLENELFGHEKGAFTGANHVNIGKIEATGRGTLFLDEIGELSLNLQKKFLGFLQSHEYVRVGGTQTLRASCRIIAATNRELAEMVEQGTFREDLYFRLKVATLYMPSLRERLSDIPLLAEYFLRKINLELGTEVWQIQQGGMDLLFAHTWTGNVRELENILVEAVIQSRGKVILVKDLEKILGLAHDNSSQEIASYSLEDVERAHIEKILFKVRWNRNAAAEQLGISLPTLRSKIRKYKLMPPEPFDG
ncbi:sigma-54-dependent Fis family transcriptional regulator [candidate division KSB3 bacterium]|uniref:DNA-binding transcriptional regulator NtrC n=1 Tax=candidate division KSB3 bacterium TaxID=2044937 RepID=A0A2G6KGH5_9BACT|nr:MAG: sigma-54-dependent Fis family transcriptional regulator [candidate division KSB3 bacterium]